LVLLIFVESLLTYVEMGGIMWIFMGVIKIFAENRQNLIYERIQTLGAVTTANLVNEFQVSVETIRRDLLQMEKNGLLKRVHGGAVKNSDMKRFVSLEERNKAFSDQKRELSSVAIQFVQEEDVIFVDAGSTAICFAQLLKESFSSLTVVTHSMDVFQILCEKKGFQLILCGGHFLKEENAFYGTLALDMLDKIHVQKAFVFPSAVSIEFGICDYQAELFQIQKQVLKCADEIFVLADSSKFEKKALLKLDDMKNEYCYITDSLLPKGLEMLYKDNNITVIKERNQ